MAEDTEHPTSGDKSDTDAETEALSAQKRLSGSKEATREVANAASTEQDGQAVTTDQMEKAGGKEPSDGNAVPSADTRSIPRSVDPNEPTSTGDTGDGGSDGGDPS